MSWYVDNATTLYILLGIIAAALVVTWRFNQRVKFLGYAAGVLAAGVLLWLLTLLVPTDRKQIEGNVHAMAKAVQEGKVDDLFKHVSEDFVYKGLTRKMLYEAAKKEIAHSKVTKIRITQFDVEHISRSNKSAKVRFKVTAFNNEQQPFPFVTKADFVLEGENWKLKGMKFYKSFVDTDQEIDLIPQGIL